MTLEKSPDNSLSFKAHLQNGGATLTHGVCVRIKYGSDCKHLEQHLGRRRCSVNGSLRNV